MKTSTSFMLAVGIVVAIAGCEDPFLGPYNLDELSFDLTITGGRPTETTVTGGPGTITVRSFVASPMCGYELSGSVGEASGGLEVKIDADFSGGLAVPCYYAYTAMVAGLPEGLHGITVVHEVEGAAGGTVVAGAIVRVR